MITGNNGRKLCDPVRGEEAQLEKAESPVLMMKNGAVTLLNPTLLSGGQQGQQFEFTLAVCVERGGGVSAGSLAYIYNSA